MYFQQVQNTQLDLSLPVVQGDVAIPDPGRARTAGDLSLPAAAPIHGAYIHVPFCFHKCHYCDFYSFVETRGREPAFVRRLIQELEAFRGRFGQEVQTIFMGGGTPTLLPVELWGDLLCAIRRNLPVVPQGEFTVEANPETVTDELADVLRIGGVNRVSIGAQSFKPAHLKTLERWHEPASVGRAIEVFRSAGLDNLNIDLIFGIPGQSLQDWGDDLDRALALRPDHLSCYSLTYEPHTPLTQKLKSGAIVRIDEDLEAAMYEYAIDLLGSRGYEHYEISNWARPGRRCRHNLLYWTNRNWWAFGPSASGHVDGFRWKNVARLSDYLDSSPWSPITDAEQLEEDGRVGEELMLRLRLIDGIDEPCLDALLARGRVSRRSETDRLIERGLMERKDRRLCLTRAGLLLADSVIAALL